MNGNIGRGSGGPFLAGLAPSTRPEIVLTQMYFLVCIPVRLALFGLVFALRKEPYTPWIVGAAALISILHLSMQPFDVGQWWSRRFQLVMAVAILSACILMHQRCIEPWVLPFLLYTSLLGGLVQRLSL